MFPALYLNDIITSIHIECWEHINSKYEIEKRKSSTSKLNTLTGLSSSSC